MASLSIPMREMLLRSFFMADSYRPPQTLYVALTVDVGAINQAGSLLNEPDAGAYQRGAIPLDSDSWQLNGFGAISNIADVDFPAPASDEDWGYLGGWAVLDAPDNGVVLAVGALSPAVYYTADLPSLSLGPGQVTLGLVD